ncbi:MAG: nuclear transport factor 2 family protein [Nitrospinota bacterium]|nr:nuclear transport factor 2 family protein [Nitrospinota bacterium]
MHTDQHILSANQSFYDAFNKQDLSMMETLWQDDICARCIHPGWPVLKGYQEIIQSWDDIFRHNQHMEIKVSDEDVVIKDDFAWVSCQENLFSIKMSGVQSSKVHATNLFQKVGGEWKMILHHAAAIPTVTQEEPS